MVLDFAMTLLGYFGAVVISLEFMWRFTKLDVLEMLIISTVGSLLVYVPMAIKIDKKEKRRKDMQNENCKVTLSGVLTEEPVFHHSIRNENFYQGKIAVVRNSGFDDVIPFIVSDKSIENINTMKIGDSISIVGDFRSHNRHNGEFPKLLLYVLVDEINFPEDYCSENSAILDGYICKKPTYRKTPLGREVSDILLAVNRNYGKTDYIPCICWGRNARYASRLGVGSRIKCMGRIQSRKYIKKNGEVTEERVAYEISLSNVSEVCSDEKN